MPLFGAPGHKVLIVREVSGQDFDRDDPVGVGVMRPPHLAHAAATQQFDQPIATERRPVHGLTVGTEQLWRGANGQLSHAAPLPRSRAGRGIRSLRAVEVLLGHSSIATSERYTAVDDIAIRHVDGGAVSVGAAVVRDTDGGFRRLLSVLRYLDVGDQYTYAAGGESRHGGEERACFRCGHRRTDGSVIRVVQVDHAVSRRRTPIFFRPDLRRLEPEISRYSASGLKLLRFIGGFESGRVGGVVIDDRDLGFGQWISLTSLIKSSLCWAPGGNRRRDRRLSKP